jgi:hypothetical protein
MVRLGSPDLSLARPRILVAALSVGQPSSSIQFVERKEINGNELSSFFRANGDAPAAGAKYGGCRGSYHPLGR